MSGVDTDQRRLKSSSGTDVRYLISYFLRKMSLIAWIVVNISFSDSATTAMVNKLLRLRRSVLWSCTWFLIRLNFCVEESSLGTWLPFVTALIITRGSLWRDPNLLNPNKHSSFILFYNMQHLSTGWGQSCWFCHWDMIMALELILALVAGWQHQNVHPLRRFFTCPPDAKLWWWAQSLAESWTRTGCSVSLSCNCYVITLLILRSIGST